MSSTTPDQPSTVDEVDEQLHAELVTRIRTLTDDAYASSASSFQPLTRRGLVALGLVYIVLPIVVAIAVYA